MVILHRHFEFCHLFRCLGYFLFIFSENGSENDKYKEDFSDHPSILKILENTTKSESEMFSFEPVKENYVHKIVSNLNVRKATGADNISAKILKSCAQSISSPISYLVNTAFKNVNFQLE